MIRDYQNIAIFKRKVWKNFPKVTKELKWKIKEDECSLYYFPKIIGKYKNKKIILRLIEPSGIRIKKTAYSVFHKLKLPNIIWIRQPTKIDHSRFSRFRLIFKLEMKI
jgi:hypothetical protein